MPATVGQGPLSDTDTACRARERKLDILVNNAGAAWGESLDAFPEAGWVTGQTLALDGGVLARAGSFSGRRRWWAPAPGKRIGAYQPTGERRVMNRISWPANSLIGGPHVPAPRETSWVIEP